MPRRKVNKKRETKRRFKPYKAKPKRSLLPVGGFPDRYLVKLRYVENITLDAGAGSYAVNEYRANSLYDPNKTGVGHQPSNFDRWAANYDRYTVLGSMIKVKPVQTSTTGFVPGLIVCHLSEAGAEIAQAWASGGVANVLEQPRMQSSVREWGNMNTTQMRPIVKKFSAKKFFGVSDIVGKDLYSADIAANPAEGAIYEVGVLSPDDSNNPGSVTIRVTIDYIAMFTEPKIADAS